MKPSRLLPLLPTLLLPLSTAPAAAPAVQVDDFPTSGRVEYVLECMQKHDGKYEYLYKCSCVVDRIAKTLRYDDYVAMSVALRNQSLAGERGGEFRDEASVRNMASKYKEIEAGANKACAVPQR
ncbi:hypothetical protein [Herbaspirillum sp. SJZ107]|uniref:hypothetical protein n=1 Tax=Herbaspirillum sp. SJZ107 TaxID=2572881 RepID=UPI0011726E0E|nr:hypothetical protein [Herbaspirillum sp. SJZ107]TQK00106.1 hypothetical protein FBX97_5869 [Herbaspirillum sp. SJZ107]